MKNFAQLTFIALFGLTVFVTTTSADVRKGQKVYLKELKVDCGFSGVKFAHSHTQDEWEAINETGKFAVEVKRLCPKSSIEYRYVTDLYSFVYAYAKDSGNLPSR
ncbi:MAG: cytochrome C [Sulfurovum sp.]|nr:cytochrome C [Sulfurovum sp.]